MGADVLGLLTGGYRIVLYTTQSAVIVLGYYLGVLYWMARRGTADPAAPRLRGAVTLWIVITGLVAHFVLNHGENPLPGLVHDDPETLLVNRSLFLVHYVVPVMVLLDWVAFGPHGAARWRDLPLWLAYPVGYGLTSMARAVLFPTVPDRYPYFFVDPTEHGYGWVWAYVLGLALAFAALGALLIGLDRLAGRLRAAAAPPGEVPVRR